MNLEIHKNYTFNKNVSIQKQSTYLCPLYTTLEHIITYDYPSESVLTICRYTTPKIYITVRSLNAQKFKRLYFVLHISLIIKNYNWEFHKL